MSTNSSDFFDKLYSERRNVFGSEPMPIVKKALEFVQSGKALDLGAGEGRNSSFLASKGFDVTAVDISSVAMEKLQQEAKDNDVHITTQVADILEFQWKESFDLIISTFTLHYLSALDAKKIILDIQNHTKGSGCNVITTFTKNGDFFNSNPETDRFYTSQEELKDMYADWNILVSFEKEASAVAKKPDGTPMTNVFAGLIAQKK